MWFYEDVPFGRRLELGTVTVSPEAIVRFARDYDPQPFHLSEEGGRASHFGGLVASGWHTGSLFMRAFVDYLDRLGAEMQARGEPAARVGPSPGFDDMRWPKPVRAGERLAFAMTAVDGRVLASRPGWALVTFESTAVDADGDLVMSFLAKVFVQRRGG